MYNAVNFKNIFPIVEIIRNIEKSIIAYKFGRNQQTITTYGIQYYHSVTGYDLKSKNDYISLMNGMVRFIFVFNNSEDPIATNLMNLAREHNKCIICFSEIDSVYHFYDTNFQKTEIKDPLDVIKKMAEIKDLLSFQKISELFSDILQEEDDPRKGSLDRCMEILQRNTLAEDSRRIKNSTKKVPPAVVKQAQYISKKMFREKKPKYEDEPVQKNLLAEFFKKGIKK